MSSPGSRETVFCHSCDNEWSRNEHGLICPRCTSEFVEVITPDDDPRDVHDAHDAHNDHEEEVWGHAGSGPGVPDLFGIGRNHPPYAAFAPPIPANRPNTDFTTYRTYRSPGGGTSFTFTSTSHHAFNSGNRGPAPDPHAEVLGSFGALLQTLIGGNTARSPPATTTTPGVFGFATGPRLQPRDASRAQQPPQLVDDMPNIMSQFFPVQEGPRSPGAPPFDPPHANPLMGMMRLMLTGHPVFAGGGDAAYSQEEFDRILSNLMEQTQANGGAPPASSTEVQQIPKKKVTTEMLGENGKAECTICMDEVKIGDEVSELWCQHWFHTPCIEMWLNEHDSCPHCRKTLQQSKEEASSQPSPRSSTRERRSSRRSSYQRSLNTSEANSNENSGEPPSAGGGIRERLRGYFGGR